MDKHTLITVIVTAAVTAAVTVIVTSIFSTIKTFIASRLMQTAKRPIIKELKRLILDVVILGMSIAGLTASLTSKEPLTRTGVFWICLSVFNVMAVAFYFIGRLTWVILDHRRSSTHL